MPRLEHEPTPDMSQSEVRGVLDNVKTNIDKALASDKDKRQEWLNQIKAQLTELRDRSNVGRDNRHELNTVWQNIQRAAKREDTRAEKDAFAQLNELEVYNRDQNQGGKMAA